MLACTCLHMVFSMCVYVYMYICMCISMHEYVYSIYASMLYIYIYIILCRHAHIHTFIHTFPKQHVEHSYDHIREIKIYKYTYTRIYVCIRTNYQQIHIYTYFMYTHGCLPTNAIRTNYQHIYTYTHILCIHMHTHRRGCLPTNAIRTNYQHSQIKHVHRVRTNS